MVRLNSRLSIVAMSIAATGMMLSSCGATHAAKPPKVARKNITITLASFPAIAPIALMQASNVLEKEGYTVKWITILSGLPTEAEAMASGSLDFAWGNTAAALAIFAAAPNVGWLVGESVTNENITVVRNGSGITKLSQLAGQKVVISGLKTASTLFYELALAKAGISSTSDTFVTSNGPAMSGVLASGAVNVAAAYTPFSSEMVLDHIGTVLVTANQAFGGTAPGDGFIVSQAFAKAHPNAVVAVLKAAQAADDLILSDPKVEYPVLAKFAAVPENVISYSISKGYIGIRRSLVPSVSAYDKIAADEQAHGFAPSGVNLVSFANSFVKPSFAKKAVG